MHLIIELLEKQLRNDGYLYSADMLGIAAVSFRKEANLSKEHTQSDKVALESCSAMH